MKHENGKVMDKQLGLVGRKIIMERQNSNMRD